jgi:hypothetical protein
MISPSVWYAKADANGVFPLAVGPNMVIICFILRANIAKKSHSATLSGLLFLSLSGIISTQRGT